MSENHDSKILSRFINLLEDLEKLKNEIIIVEFLTGVLQQFKILEEPKHAKGIKNTKLIVEKVSRDISAVTGCENQMAILMRQGDIDSFTDTVNSVFSEIVRPGMKNCRSILDRYANMKDNFGQSGENLRIKITTGYERVQTLKKIIKGHLDYFQYDLPNSLEKSAAHRLHPKNTTIDESNSNRVIEELLIFRNSTLVSLQISLFLSGQLNKRTFDALHSILKLMEIPEPDKLAAKFWPIIEHFDEFCDDSTKFGFSLWLRVELKSTIKLYPVVRDSQNVWLDQHIEILKCGREFEAKFQSLREKVAEMLNSLKNMTTFMERIIS